jgi:hypothetical protein
MSEVWRNERVVTTEQFYLCRTFVAAGLTLCRGQKGAEQESCTEGLRKRGVENTGPKWNVVLMDRM